MTIGSSNYNCRHRYKSTISYDRYFNHNHNQFYYQLGLPPRPPLGQ